MSLTPKQIFEEKVSNHVKNNPDLASEVQAAFQFDLTGDGGGQWAIDLRSGPGQVTEGTIAEPTVAITMASKDFVDLVEGRLNGQMAFMQGKLKLKGDMSKALKLQKVLGS